MLRASATATETDADLATVRDPAGEGGVTAAAELAALVDAVVDADGARASSARSEVTARLGPDATVDVVAVLANFEMMTRIADGSGAVHESVDAEVARATGADRFTSAPEAGSGAPGG